MKYINIINENCFTIPIDKYLIQGDIFMVIILE